jgi:hypothetical protein
MHKVTTGPGTNWGWGAWCVCGKKWIGFASEKDAKARAELHLRVAETVNGDPHGR